MQQRNRKSVYKTIRDYAIITVAMLIGTLGYNLFLLPNQIPMPRRTPEPGFSTADGSAPLRGRGAVFVKEN